MSEEEIKQEAEAEVKQEPEAKAEVKEPEVKAKVKKAEAKAEAKKPSAKAEAKKSAAIDEIMTAIKNMTVLELAELVKTLQTEFGVSAPAMMAAPAAQGEAAARLQPPRRKRSSPLFSKR